MILQERRRLFTAVTVGHLGIDLFNSMGPVVVTFLMVPLGLSPAQVGLAVGSHQFLAGATQPAFGWLVDRVGSRVLGPVSVAWAIGFLAFSVAFAPRLGWKWFLFLFACSALGSGAFHPQGTLHASRAVPGRESTTTSLFFLFGQVGLALGPISAGLALDRFGPRGVGALGMAALCVPLWMAWRMSGRRLESVAAVRKGDERSRHELPTRGSERETQPAVIALLAMLFSLRAWIFIGTAAFLPLLFSQKGFSATGQGVLVGSFWMGGALGGVAAGLLADRGESRLVVALATLAGCLALPFLVIGTSPAGSVLLALAAGAGLGAPHSILMVMAQKYLPLRRGLASGAALGFLFACGALASFAIGWLSEPFALQTILLAGVGPGLLVALLALMLPREAEPSAVVEFAGDLS